MACACVCVCVYVCVGCALGCGCFALEVAVHAQGVLIEVCTVRGAGM